MAGRKKIFVKGSNDFMQKYSSLASKSQSKKEIDAAIDQLKGDPLSGEKIERRLWPRRYVGGYQINNLFRYRLAAGHRLTYTLLSDSTQTICIILDLLSHKEYDELFGYRTS